MTKRLLAVILSLCVLASTMVGMTLTASAETWDGSVATEFAGGSGTESDPYQIATGAQLAYLATLINGSSNSTYCSCYYVLTADIDLNNISWTPIGYSSIYCFKGAFDGDGHTISNLYMSSTSLYGGLFGRVSQATIKNVTLSNCNITGYTYSGGIVGYVQGMSSTVIQNCTVSGSVSCVQTSSTSPCIVGGIAGNGNYTSLIGCVNNATVTVSSIGSLYAGGLAGSLSNGTISSCCNNGSVAVSYDDAKSEYVGGLVGDLSSKSTVSDSYNTGSVTADLSGILSDAYAGGLFGQVGTSCTVTECYNAGVVTATATSTVYAGGLAGVSNATSATISNCYNAGTVSGTAKSTFIGGLVGYNYMKNTIQNCHNVGTVSGTTSNYIGGIAGQNGGTITNAYYLSTSASAGVGKSTGSGKPVSKTAEEFASGEVAYLLNGSVSGGTPWYQTLGTDSYPVLDSTHGTVYSGTNCAGTTVYSNSTVPAATHSLTRVETQEATCTKAGNSEYFYCSECGGYFSDTAGVVPTSLSAVTIAATGHQNVTHSEYKSATCTAEGNIEYWYCSDCGKYFSDSNYENVISQSDTVIAAIAHKNAEKVAAVDATCTTAGNIEYWYCSDCNCYFSDADCTQAITQAETITSALGHTLQHFEAVEAGCDTVGNVEYWYCGDCDTYFSDADATAEITPSQTVVEATGEHEYEVSAIVWNYEDGTATVKCLECGAYHTFDATVTSKNVLGQKTYTITVSINGTEYTDTKTTGTSLMMVQASYSAVTAAIEKANSLNPSDYEDFTPVTDAINAVDWSLSVLNQNQVNSYAEAIEEAINNLVLAETVNITEETIEVIDPVEAGETDSE